MTVSRFRIEVGSASDVGRVREQNQDRCATWVPELDEGAELTGLLLVADGMGGERGGERASELAAERIVEWVTSGAYRSWPEYQDRREVSDVLYRAVRDISDELFLIGEQNDDLRGLGSTVVLVVVIDRRVSIVHVGDSRCYRIRDCKIRQLTTDHTWVEDQLEAGVLTPEQAQNHPQRNVLTRSLGDSATPEADVRTEPLRDGDLFILCSDGLTGGVADSLILDTFRKHAEPQELAEALVNLANERDGSDNVTVVVGRCEDCREKSAGGIFEPDDTQPMERPKLDELLPTEELPAPKLSRRQSSPRRDLWLVLATALATLLLTWYSIRLYTGHRLKQAATYLEQGQYLQGRQELRDALQIGLEPSQADKVLDVIFGLSRLPSEEPSVDEESEEPSLEESPPAGDEGE